MRYLLDTNVFSELVKLRPNVALFRRFVDNSPRLVTASMVLYEMLDGLHRMPASKKRKVVAKHIEGIRRSIPILSYDERAADWHAYHRRKLEKQGISTSIVDGQIAAIAATNGCVLVTHNLRHFESFEGLQVETWMG